MKIFQALFAVLFLGATVLYAQNAQNEKFRFVGSFSINDRNDRILAYDVFNNGKTLRLIGVRTIQFWDLENKRAIETIEYKNPDAPKFDRVSPDKTKFVILGKEVRLETERKAKDATSVKAPAFVFNANTGELLKKLEDTAKPINSAMWSANGSTLVTFGDRVFPARSNYTIRLGGELEAPFSKDVEIAFWDGLTLEKRAAITIENITWRHLTADGEILLTVSGLPRSIFGIDYVSEKAAAIDVWNTRTGKLIKQIPLADSEYFIRSRKLKVAEDGKTLAFVLKSRKTGANDKMIVWDINGTAFAPKFTLKANPKISDSEIGYSPDSDLVALDTGDDTQFYDLQTGSKKFEVVKMDVPDFWLDNNKIGLYNKSSKIRAVAFPSGNVLYEQPVIYRTEERDTGGFSTDANGNHITNTETVVVDFTRLRPHPDGKMILAFSNQALRVYDAATGKILQELVTPPPVVTRKAKVLGFIPIKEVIYGENRVSNAEWAEDKQKIVMLDTSKEFVSIWTMN